MVRCLDDNSIDSVVTDPPYAISFMGKHWDDGSTAFAVEFWAEILRVLKPGGHVAAFGGTRSYHRLACAIEDAGFEIRDQIAWCYGTGFPKSHNAGNGWGTALKPAWESLCLARKPLSEKTVINNVLRWGTGAINVDGCRVAIDDSERATIDNRSGAGQSTEGWGHVGNRAEGARYKSAPLGRFPANLCHDGSDEVLAAFPETKTNANTAGVGEYENISVAHGKYAPRPARGQPNDSGSAARFFYSAKASKADRALSKHPTVKPVKLMQWVVRLITPPGGVTLDPFAGTGTTGEAAWREGFSAVLIEREEEYQADIERRMSGAERLCSFKV